ncbi:MAG: DHA2 family efflux MFS transporter permease subunit [Candidatus Tectomicrobia bacterium]|nr:DHA2 family efflux MFS transporter permease subunit [Candidatus Tectomicrobia bacterium]
MTREAPPIEERQLYKLWVSLSLILGSIAISFDQVNVALPKMMSSLMVNVDKIQWTMTAPQIARTLMMPTIGWVGARIGNRNLYVASLLVFVVSSILCGIAWNADALIFFRILMGIGQGPIQPLAMAILYQTYPPDQRGYALGLSMFGSALGLALSPSIGGFLIEYVSWRALFYANIPLALASIVMILPLMKNVIEKRSGSIDYAGLITMTTFLVPLLLAINSGRQEGWDSVYILTLFTISIVSFIAFVFAELTITEPFIDLSLFKYISFSASSLIRFISLGLGYNGGNLITTLLLQKRLGFTAFQEGIIRIPTGLGMSFTGLLVGKLTDKFDPKIFIIVALFFYALIWYSFVLITPWSTMWFIATILFFRALAFSIGSVPLTTAALKTLPDEKVRLGSGLTNVITGIGGSLGFVLITSFFSRREAYHSIVYMQDPNLSSASTKMTVSLLRQTFERAGDLREVAAAKSFALIRTQLMDEASLAAYYDCFTLVAFLVLISIIPAFFIQRKKGEE